MTPAEYDEANQRVWRERIAAASPFMCAAVRAYHRAERDTFARLAEAMGIGLAVEWRGASRHVNRRKGDPAHRLWSWGLRRWGLRDWPDLEYAIRETDSY